MASQPAFYAELHCISNFTFLRGASHPEELMMRARELGYSALALTDECSVAGVVRAHNAAKVCGMKLLIGSEIRLNNGPALVLLAATRQGYGNLCHVITHGRRAADKGKYCLNRVDIERDIKDCLALILPASPSFLCLNKEAYKQLREQAHWVRGVFPGNAWIALELLRGPYDREYLEQLERLSDDTGLPLVAAGGVHMHHRNRRPLRDVMTAIRLGQTVQAAGYALSANAEHCLRTRRQLVHLYPEKYLQQTLAISERCRFSLDELRYEYPEELVPEGETPTTYLRYLTESGVHRRWPQGIDKKTRDLIEHELRLIAELNYEPYFLTVYDIVRFAREQNILCQGRGSAANSAVCFCLGITEVDPVRIETLFERFISKERNEPPDIDVDFEHERREEVIQYIYNKYGRDRAALAATVITYRVRSAIRDVGKAMGLSLDQVDRLAKNIQWWDGKNIAPERLKEIGFNPDNPVINHLLRLTQELLGFPRHLSQHVGGFVISRGILSSLVPIENASMPERTVIQWDKDDLESLGLLKVDCLGLGMLSVIRRAFDLIRDARGQTLTMATVPAEDPKVYEMIQQADTIGVFQIESRAQMVMLPRLKPDCFYDLVVEIAIVRPGPIQGDMVHPYLRRRQGLESVSYPSEAVQKVLQRTLGVPIFQEQVIKLAMVAAGFSPGEADQLRRSMAAWRRRGGLEHFEQRLIGGMGERGYSEKFARQIFQQILGFGEYGFPESHAASFALLAYISAWLKYYEPAAFTCALLNSQPMGFYAPAQLVQDAQRHGVEVRPVNAQASFWDCTLEYGQFNRAALRLGLRMVKGLSHSGALRLVEARGQKPYKSPVELARRALLNKKDLQSLAAAGALEGFAGNRHQAQWQVAGVQVPLPVFSDTAFDEPPPLLRPPTEGENIISDYSSIGLSLRKHPLALLRDQLNRRRVITARQIKQISNGESAHVAGLVLARQRPGSASGVIFVTLEDETGVINVVVWSRVIKKYRRQLLQARLLSVAGEVQREGQVLHLIAESLWDYSSLLGTLCVKSRDFH